MPTDRRRPATGRATPRRAGAGRAPRSTSARAKSSGSARPAAAPPVRKTTPVGRRRPASLRRMVTAGVLAVMLAVLLVPTLRNYLQQRAQIESLNSQVTEQQRVVRGLQTQRDRWDDPAYVAQQARERLGFAKPGEKAYIVIDDTGKKRDVEQVTGVRKDSSVAGRPWYGQLWGSSVTAGKTPKVGAK